MNRIPADELRRLRNAVDISTVICELQIPLDFRGKRPTFRCPCCQSFHTALNPHANLARCFRCQRNFNTIDLVMAERGDRFLDAVRYLRELIVATR